MAENTTEDDPRPEGKPQPAYPKTAAEWWANFDGWKAELRALVAKFHPMGRKSNTRKYPISATLAEAACEVIREEIKENPQLSMHDFDQAVVARDAKTLVRLINNAWFGMPESMAVREEPGFFVLCDLCSEAYVLFEGEPPRENA